MKNNKSKGDRLNWTPLKDIKPIKLNDDLTKGRRLNDRVLDNRSHQKSPNRDLLVP